MDAGAPAARAEHQIAGNPAALGGPVRRRHERRPDATGAGDTEHRVAAPHLDPERGQLGDERLGRAASDVGEHRHLDPGLDELPDRAVRRVVVGHRDRPVPRAHPVAADEGECRGGEHHPGAIVVGEHQRPLRRAGGEHHAPRPNLPQAFVDPGLRGRQLDHGEQVVVVVAGDGGLVEPYHVGKRIELRRRIRRPLDGGTPADFRRGVEKHAPRHRPVVGDHHPGGAARRGQRRLKPGRTRPRDQHIAVVKALLVRVPAGASRGRTESRHPAHQRSVEVPPAGQPHERLVVETGRKQWRQPVVDRTRVESDTRPAVDAAGTQTLPEREGRSSDVRLVVFAIELHDGVGLLRPGGDDPPRAVVLEAAPYQAHPVGHQRRGEGVAGVALVFLPIEPEPKPAGAIDQRPAGGEPEWLEAAHRRNDSMTAPGMADLQGSAARNAAGRARNESTNTSVSGEMRAINVRKATGAPSAGRFRRSARRPMR